jgi:5'-methylthioadenosine phosphorylase
MKIGVIGGSGLYDIEGLEVIETKTMQTPFGDPSDAFVISRYQGCDLVFLPRHGKGHRLLPGELNHQANVYGMKALGVEAIVSISAVGSFKEELPPGNVVLVDQFIDRTRRGRDQTFFGNGVAAHVSMAHPTCAQLRAKIGTAIDDLLAEDNPNDISYQMGGTYLNMEGPGFSTLAESLLFKSWGLDVIGMTNMIEAKLAREAEICYQTVAMVTDFDCWHPDHDAVEVEQIIATLMQNADFGKNLIKRLVPMLSKESQCECCSNALKFAIITAPDAIPEERKQALAPIIGKYM